MGEIVGFNKQTGDKDTASECGEVKSFVHLEISPDGVISISSGFMNKLQIIGLLQLGIIAVRHGKKG